ncbi:MAG: DUF2779 domain-containing protein, partial [Bacteroidia bacterium]|nr:DUF2779 domain-containing protein [Bacteroidia bacterium]
MLSKSRIIRGVQCHKSLWLHKHQPQLREISDDLQAVFDTGTQVGLLAQQKFPGGTDASEGHEWPNFECADTTKYLLGIGQKVIYEATFVHNKVLVAVDILVKNELGSWDAYEVKSTNSLKSPHIMDCAIQFHVITSYSLDIRSFSVMHFNKKYVRQGELDIKQLFTSTDITEEVLELQEELPEVIDELEAIQQQETCPELAIGSHCDEPYECDFKAYCWKHIPEYSVFDLTNPRNRDWELYEKGILKIKDIPVDYAMGEKHRIQHLAEITGKSHIVKDEIDHFLSDLEYPIYYFDFETMMTAVPMYDNTRTYQQIPFQYSVHKQPSFGAECEHREFLPQVESGVKSPDPREELISHLVRDLGEKGSIVA